MKLPTLKNKKLLILFFFFFFIFVLPVFADNEIYNETWQVDPQVTEVGKNAERARQLLYWVFTHPPSYTVPVLAKVWGLSRNIVYALFILVIAIVGVALILKKRDETIGPIFSGIASPIFGLSIPSFFFKILILLIYVTFSYLLVLGLIQISEIVSRFFAERYFGCHLFNIKFAETGTSCRLDPNNIFEMEKNYVEFVGYKDKNFLNQESATIGILMVKLTTLTYNVFSVVLILRQVILWFLLMLSPFLALLLPFIFIRNTGYIWIGVFFQWLFYGPLVALFLSGLVLIWQAGIPYAFNFTRINQPTSQIFPTAINILYGGPGQILTPTNSSNYVDTYAEYIIALIMLWVAIFLPWLLLRIFRDYCCDILRQNQATLLSILGKIRDFGKPPPSPPPAGLSTQVKLPFRRPIEEIKKVELKSQAEISTLKTHELSRSLSLSVSSLTEVARYEMNTQKKRQILETLNHIANPFVIPSVADRERFSLIKKELELRAQAGDKQAQQILSAALKQPIMVTPLPLVKEFPEITTKEAVNTLVKETTLTKEKLSEVLKELPQISVANQVNVLADRLQVPQVKIKNTLDLLPQFAPKGVEVETMLVEVPYLAGEIGKRVNLTEKEVRNVLAEYSQITLSQNERVEKIAKETTISSEQVREVLERLPQVIINFYPQFLTKVSQNKPLLENVSKETNLEKEKVREVLTQVSSLAVKPISQEAVISQVSQKTGLSEEKTRQIIKIRDILTRRISTQEEIINEIAKETLIRKEKVSQALEQLEKLWLTPQLTQTGIVAQVAQKTGISEKSVENILKTASVLQTQQLTEKEIINKIVEQTAISKEKVEEVLKTTSEAIINKVSQLTLLTQEKVKEIQKLSQLLTSQETSVWQESVVEWLAQKTALSQEKVREVLQLTQETEKEKIQEKLSLEEVKKIAQVNQISVEEVEKIIKTTSLLLPQFAPELGETILKEQSLIERIAQEADIPPSTVRVVLQKVSQLLAVSGNLTDQVAFIAEKTQLSPEKIKDVLSTLSAVHLEPPATSKPKIVRHPAVSIEDYEEVKNMWLNHYKLSEVPTSESIKNREDWLREDIRILTNTLDLLTSLNPKDKEKGMKQVAAILPFLLLGGFSEVETVIYLKAKLQAAKLALEQLEEKEKLKEELKKEEEETLVEIPRPVVKEEEKTFQTEESFALSEEELKPEVDKGKN